MSPLSIGVPVYNQVTTIRQTIAGILAQSLAPLEIVVSENHSTDGTLDALREFGNAIKIVQPPEHCTIAANWNHCVRSCSGTWVGLCSGDDILLPNYVTEVTHAISSHKDAVFVMGGWEILNESTGKIESHYLLSMSKITKPPKTIEMNLAGPKAAFAAFAFKREAFDRIGGYRENYQTFPDYVLQFDLAPLGDFIKIDKCIARYRSSQIRPSLERERGARLLKERIHFAGKTIWNALEHGVPHLQVKKAAVIHLKQLTEYIKRTDFKPDLEQQAKLEAAMSKAGFSPLSQSNPSFGDVPLRSMRFVKGKIRKVITRWKDLSKSIS